MSGSVVYLERWAFCALRDSGRTTIAMVAVNDDIILHLTIEKENARAHAERAALVAAAPALLRDALLTEWLSKDDEKEWCPTCGSVRPAHLATCGRDEALAQAGFADQEIRDAARRMMTLCYRP